MKNQSRKMKLKAAFQQKQSLTVLAISIALLVNVIGLISSIWLQLQVIPLVIAGLDVFFVAVYIWVALNPNRDPNTVIISMAD